MSNKVNDIDVKHCTCYFFNDIINVENFCPSIIKIDEKSQKVISYLLYWIPED